MFCPDNRRSITCAVYTSELLMIFVFMSRAVCLAPTLLGIKVHVKLFC